jgi:hypothetical protein
MKKRKSLCHQCFTGLRRRRVEQPEKFLILSKQNMDNKEEPLDIEFIPLISSSLGTILNNTIKCLSKIARAQSKNPITLCTKRLVLAVIKGSLAICVKAKARNKRRKRQ